MPAWVEWAHAMSQLNREPNSAETMLRPVLLIDIGDTLLHRDGGGRRTLVSRTLRQHAVEPATIEKLLTELQTARNWVEFSSSGVLASLDEAPREAALRAAGQASEVEPTVLDGAEDLLLAARDSGWRVLACSDAVAWQAELPQSIAQHVQAEVRSSTVGALKSSPEFWQALLRDYQVNAQHALMVGDNPVNDGASPRSMGLCSAVLGSRLRLRDIADWVRAVPALQRPEWLLACGPDEQWGGQLIAGAPHLHALVERVTRVRGTAITASGKRPIVLARRQELAPALIWRGTPVAGLCWIQLFTDQRHQRHPDDLVVACEAAGVQVDSLSVAEQRHLVSMVKEAKDPDIRRARIEDVIALLRSAGG